MKAKPIALFLMTAVLLLSACTPQARQTPAAQPTLLPTQPAPSATPIPPAALAAQKVLANELGLELSKVAIIAVEARDWPDACLGVPNPTELCAAMITPGFEVTLDANGERAVYRTDLSGEVVRRAPDLPPAEIVGPLHAARLILSEKLGLAPDDFKLESYTAVDWPDTCLGAGQPDEVCAAVVTPGYKLILSAEGKTYEAHTDQTGGEARIVSGLEGLEGTAAESAARQALAQQLNVAADTVRVISSTKETWPDGCLGLAQPGEMCIAVMTPGHFVKLEAAGKTYAVRTNLDGSVARVDPSAPAGQADNAAITWKLSGETCQTLSVQAGGQAAFGPCGAAPTSAELASIDPARPRELATLLAAYAPFSAKTPAGEIEFNGAGSETATAAEQRSIAEWMRRVSRELTIGQSTLAQGQALTWHREGGIAGFCDDLSIGLDGFVRASSCKGAATSEPRVHRLSAEQIETLYQWTAAYAPFEYSHTDPAVADAMTIRLAFFGAGQTAATPAQQDEIVLFAQTVWTEANK